MSLFQMAEQFDENAAIRAIDDRIAKLKEWLPEFRFDLLHLLRVESSDLPDEYGGITSTTVFANALNKGGNTVPVYALNRGTHLNARRAIEVSMTHDVVWKKVMSQRTRIHKITGHIASTRTPGATNLRIICNGKFLNIVINSYIQSFSGSWTPSNRDLVVSATYGKLTKDVSYTQTDAALIMRAVGFPGNQDDLARHIVAKAINKPLACRIPTYVRMWCIYFSLVDRWQCRALFPNRDADMNIIDYDIAGTQAPQIHFYDDLGYQPSTLQYKRTPYFE